MLEIHLFVNPLDRNCINCEREIIDLGTKESSINYSFIPIINMKTISKTLKKIDHENTSLLEWQKISNLLYQMSLDYEAALFQGKHRGRQFLVGMQQSLLENLNSYTENIILRQIKKAGIDVATFMDDRKSSLAKECFIKDQKMALKYGIRKSGQTLILDTNNSEFEVLLPEFNKANFAKCIHDGYIKTDNRLYNFEMHQPNLRII